MSWISSKGLLLLLLLVLLVVCSTFDACEARRGKHWRAKRATLPSLAKKKGKGKTNGSHHHGGSGAGSNSPKPSNPPSQSPIPGKGYPPVPQAVVFNVLDFGAKGDGVTDDTKAFQAAWAAACKVEASTVVIPSENVFLVGPISFSGPYCQPNIVFQVWTLTKANLQDQTNFASVLLFRAGFPESAANTSYTFIQ